jgi:excisionase family DNA binding protein
MATTESAYLSVAELAQTLGLNEATVYRRVWDGSLPTVRLSERGAIRIPATALDEFARTSETPARAPRTAREAAVEPPAHGGDHLKPAA